jgi:putative hydrolase of the HAD superfamily
MSIAIEYLADHLEAIPVLAEWLFEEWGDRSPTESVEEVAKNLRKRANRDRLPLALVALDQANLVGTVSLRIREMEIRPEYEHWLGTLYVSKPQRNQGVGSRLVQSAKEEAIRLGITRLYLYTRHPDSQRLYKTLGFVEIERPDYLGRPAIIMETELHS